MVTGCAGHKPLCSFRYLGQINTTDFFTRLLAGITYTGLAPASFYKDPSGPDRHFDGMCATFTLALLVQDNACICCIHAHVEVYGMSYMSRMRGSYLPFYAARQDQMVRRPVDYVAAGIAGVLSHHRSGFDAYHMVNPHWDDGVSLDTIVGWLSETRSGVRHIQDYAQWCAPPKAQPVVPAGLVCSRFC